MNIMMDHPRIDDERILDRYVIGDLQAEEEARFEEHLFECTDCLEKVQWAEELRRGLRAAATEDVIQATVVQAAVVQQVATRGARTWLHQRRGLVSALAAFGLAFALLSTTALRQHRELQSLRQGAAAAPSDALNAPVAQFQVISLGVVRGTSANPLVDASAGEVGLVAGRPLLLSLELPTVEAASYSVSVFDEESKLLWRGDDLQPTLYDSLAVALPAGFLTAGTYRIRIGANTRDREASAASIDELFEDMELRIAP